MDHNGKGNKGQFNEEHENLNNTATLFLEKCLLSFVEAKHIWTR